MNELFFSVRTGERYAVLIGFHGVFHVLPFPCYNRGYNGAVYILIGVYTRPWYLEG